MGAFDFFSGIGHGLLSLVGAGKLYDPIGDLRGKLANAVAQQNSMVASEALAGLQVEQTELQDLYQLMQANQDKMKKMNEVNNALLWNSVEETNMFITFLGMSVLVIVFFMISERKCC